MSSIESRPGIKLHLDHYRSPPNKDMKMATALEKGPRHKNIGFGDVAAKKQKLRGYNQV